MRGMGVDDAVDVASLPQAASTVTSKVPNAATRGAERGARAGNVGSMDITECLTAVVW